MADIVGRVVGWISPKAAARRTSWQIRLKALRELDERGYDGARRDRLTSDWHAFSRSGDAELLPDLNTLKARCKQMCRDNPYAAAAKRNLAAHLAGNGIEARATHPDPKVAKAAQDYWSGWCRSKVDGRNDFYGVQKLVALSLVDEGEKLILWKAKNGRPDVRLEVLDGDYLDSTSNKPTATGGWLRAGVETDADGDRVAYQLWNRHPGDLSASGVAGLTSSRIEAKFVDHIFEAKWGGQTRGEPLFHAGVRRLREVSETEESVRIKKRVEACLALIRTRAADESADSLGTQKKDDEGKTLESLSPGMIASVPAGETVQVVNPSSSGDPDGFLRSQLMAVAVSLGIPYHMLTGDVSQANYSSLRAAIVIFYALLDDWQDNVLVPLLCDPAFERTMRRAAMETGDKRYLEVTAEWTGPDRPWVDPLKDITAEIMEIRAFPGLMAQSYSRRGIDMRAAFAEQFQANQEMDLYGLASDGDPRKVNGVGNLQPPSGFVIAKAGADSAAKSGAAADRALKLIQRSLRAEDDGDDDLAAACLREAVQEFRRAA